MFGFGRPVSESAARASGLNRPIRWTEFRSGQLLARCQDIRLNISGLCWIQWSINKYRRAMSIWRSGPPRNGRSRRWSNSAGLLQFIRTDFLEFQEPVVNNVRLVSIGLHRSLQPDVLSMRDNLCIHSAAGTMQNDRVLHRPIRLLTDDGSVKVRGPTLLVTISH